MEFKLWLELQIKDTKIGKAVFADKDYKKGDKVFSFKGETITKDEIIDPNHVIQISKDKYLDKSGDFDDYANHSCNPNCGIRGRDLIAIRTIKKGDEITWDYSTTIDDDWEMKCKCGESNCRRTVKRFDKIPDRYIKLNIVPNYVRSRK